MKLIIVKNYKEMSSAVADIFIEQIQANPQSVLGLATGGTPEGMYKLLIKANKKGTISFKDIKTFNLDEYIGIEENHPMSYRTFMNKNFFDQIDINKDNTHVPKGQGNIKANAKTYDDCIAKNGGIDLQVLGIGLDAHIAFNEPPAPKDSMTGITNLRDSTIEANSRYFPSKDDVPRTAITMGIGSILKARKIVLIASGKNKAQAIYDTLNATPNPNVPSSWLQTHNDVTIIVDKDAAALLEK